MADELLRALGRVQGAQQAERERVHASPAAATDELLRPLDADEQASILDAVLGSAASGKDVAARTEPAGVGTGAGTVGGAGAREGGVVVPLVRPPARRAWLAGAGSLAAAAALMVVLWRSDGGGDDVGLPAYSVVEAGGEASVRGEPERAEVLRLRADTALDLRLAPARPIDGEVGVRVIATQGDVSRWVDVDGAVEVANSGVIRLRGRAGAWLALPPGAWTLELVIGRPDRLPDDLEAYRSGVDRPQARGWQIERVQVQVEG